MNGFQAFSVSAANSVSNMKYSLRTLQRQISKQFSEDAFKMISSDGKLTKHIYSSAVPKYNFEVLVLSTSIFIFILNTDNNSFNLCSAFQNTHRRFTKETSKTKTHKGTYQKRGFKVVGCFKEVCFEGYVECGMMRVGVCRNGELSQEPDR